MDSFRELVGLDNHYKLVATVTWLLGLAGDIWYVLHGAPYTFILAFTSLVFVAPYGLKGLTAWLNRPSGTSDAQAILTEVQAQITARRSSAGNDHEPTD